MQGINEMTEGRVSMGKSRCGDDRAMYRLDFNGREVWQLQRVLETLAVRSEDYFSVRRAVTLAEALRREVAKNQGRGLPWEGDGGE